MTHQSVEEGKLESAPFEEEDSSYFWLLALVALISSLILPQFFVGSVVEAIFKDVILEDIRSSFVCFEAMFYIRVAIFLLVTDHVQRPYLEYSSKRWGLITGMRGYQYSTAFTMGLKIVAPLFLLYVTSSLVPMATIVAITPFLVGCVAQIAFERSLDKRQHLAGHLSQLYLRFIRNSQKWSEGSELGIPAPAFGILAPTGKNLQMCLGVIAPKPGITTPTSPHKLMLSTDSGRSNA